VTVTKSSQVTVNVEDDPSWLTAALVNMVLAEAEELGALTLRDLLGEVPAYRHLDDERVAVLTAATEQVLPLCLAALAGEGHLPDEALAALEAVGAERAAQGYSLDTVLHAFRVSRRRAWQFLMAKADTFPPSPALLAAVGELAQRLADQSDDSFKAISRGHHGRRERDLSAAARAQAQLINSILAGTSPRDGRLIERARRLGCDVTVPHAVLLLAPLRDGSDDPSSQLGPARTALLARRPDALDGSVRGEPSAHAVVLAPCRSAADWRAVRGAALDVAEGHGLVVLATEPVAGVDGLHHAYASGAQLVPIASHVAVGPTVFSPDELAVYRIVASASGEDRAALLGGPVERLLGLPSRQRDRYVATLWAVYDARGDLRRAATTLNISYRTVYGHLREIRERTGISLDDPDTAVRVFLALHALRASDL
jgi:PucR C-terminal helix-turn-helix domain/GGDEF-like domain